MQLAGWGEVRGLAWILCLLRQCGVLPSSSAPAAVPPNNPFIFPLGPLRVGWFLKKFGLLRPFSSLT